MDKKKFTWLLEVIDEKMIKIVFKFENPIYISQDDLIDTVKISFQNTNLYMKPEDKSKNAIPNGYTITTPLPL